MKCFKKRLSLLLAIVLCVSLLVMPATATESADVHPVDITPVSTTTSLTGAGTETEPYLINNIDELKLFRDLVNGGNTYDNAFVKLTADIDLNNEAWTPIGNGTNKFLGTFDGNNNTISNLKVDVNTNHAGLFGFASVVKNVKLKNASVSGIVCVGSLVGELESSVSRVDNCHVSGTIQISGENSMGGLVGKGYTRIYNSSVIGDAASFVKGAAGTTEEGDNVGGIIGHLGEGSGLGVSGSTVTGITILGTRKVGGIVGTIERCNFVDNNTVSSVTIECTATADYANEKASTTTIGGLIGNFFGTGVGGTVTGNTVTNVTLIAGNAKSAGIIVGGNRTTPGEAFSGITATGNTASGVTGATNNYFAVAAINDQLYPDLQSALAELKHGDTVTLLGSVTLANNLSIDKKITVYGMEYLTIGDGVKLTISAGTYDKDVTDFCAEGFKSVANEDGTYRVTQKVGLPEVVITDIADRLTENDPELTFALNYAIKDMENLSEEYLNDLFLGYGHYYTDYVLTIKGLTDENVTFNANKSADGYLAGRYAAYEDGDWLEVPFDDVTVTNGKSIYIMAGGAELMDQSGLRFTLAQVAQVVQNFDCGIYFTDEFQKANHDMEVTLELKVFTEEEKGNIADEISVATKYFNLHSTTEVPAKAKTCTTDGNIAHWKCENDECGKLFADEKATKPLTEEEVTLKASHELKKVDAVEATCTKEGTAEHYKCVCGKLFSDKDAQTEVTAKDLVVAMKAHTLEEQKEVPATYTAPGKIAHYLCSVCKKTFSDAEGKTPITKLEIPQLIEVVGNKAEVSEGAMDVAIQEAGTTGEVKLDLTHDDVIGEENAPVSSAELPVAALEKVAEAEASLTLTKADAVVTLDTKALEAVAKQAEGTTVTLVVEQIEVEELTQTQLAAINEKNVSAVISAELICNETNKPIGTEAAGGFGEGKITVKIPFTPEEGFKGTDYMVYYVADNGTITPVTTGYEGGYLIVELEHLSEYVVVNTAAEEEPKPTEPTVPEETTKPTEPTVPETTVPQETTKPTEPTKPTNPTVPNTGDDGIVLPLVMMLICGTAAVCLISKKKALF